MLPAAAHAFMPFLNIIYRFWSEKKNNALIAHTCWNIAKITEVNISGKCDAWHVGASLQLLSRGVI